MAEVLKSSVECFNARPRVCVTVRPMLSQSPKVDFCEADKPHDALLYENSNLAVVD